MANAITLDIDLDSGTVEPVPQPPGQGDVAELSENAILNLQLRNGWAPGTYIRRVEFFGQTSAPTHTQPGPPPGTSPIGTWSAGTTTPTSIDGKFDVQASTTQPSIVEVKDVQNITQGEERYWYRVTMSDGRTLDPEVINKSGSGTATWTSKH